LAAARETSVAVVVCRGYLATVSLERMQKTDEYEDGRAMLIWKFRNYEWLRDIENGNNRRFLYTELFLNF
jgi:hypothetical protein